MVRVAKAKTLNNNVLVIDTETTGVNPHTALLLGISIADGEKATYHEDTGCLMVQLYFTEKIVGQNIKYDLIMLRKAGFNIPDAYFDTMVAHYLLHIDRSHKLENIVGDLFGYKKLDLVETYNKSTGENRVNLPEDWYNHIKASDLAQYAKEDAKWTRKVYDMLSFEFENTPILKKWFYDVEMPLVNILTKMELLGVKVNKPKLSQLESDLVIETQVLEKKLKWLSGIQNFNLNSPLQMREVLYKKFKLPVLEQTTKGKPSTDKATLLLLNKTNPHLFLTLLLEYREKSKVLSTYTSSLIEQLDVNNRLHTTYNQALTHTRRFSSDHPNLQNIPTRSELGKKIKACFIPEVDHKFLIADYSQLEPRILAHLSDDKFMIEVFKNNEDIYKYTTNIVTNAGFKNFSRDQAKRKSVV